MPPHTLTFLSSSHTLEEYNMLSACTVSLMPHTVKTHPGM